MSHHRMVSPWLATRKWKEAQGWANEAAKSGDTQACGCGYGLDPGAALSCRWGERGNRWDHATGEEVRGKKYTDMEACNLGGNLFNNTTTPFTTIIYFFGSLSQCMDFHYGDNKMKEKKSLKKRNNKCIIGHLSGCHIVFSFLTFHGVCETVPSSSLHSASVHSNSLKPPA